MTQPLTVTLKTLTPIWTGGVDQNCDRLHETGLIGSLRWWYEALVRALGGDACDPVGGERCTFDEEKYQRSKAPSERERLREAGVCDVCQLFGCTGWSRRFLLRVSTEGNPLLEQSQNVLIPSGRVHNGRAGGWYLFGAARIGDMRFELIPLHGADLSPLWTILQLISCHASLGAKGASGYGVVELADQSALNADLSWAETLSNTKSTSAARKNTLPDLRDFFFAKLRFEEPNSQSSWWKEIRGIKEAIEGKLSDGSSPKPLRAAATELERAYQQGILPIAPAIRNWLRHKWEHGLTQQQDEIFGGTRRKAVASKILVSHAYRTDNRQWEIRIWGWLPCKGLPGGQDKFQRDKFLERLKGGLEGKALWQFVFSSPVNAPGIQPGLKSWHELKCDAQSSGFDYLKNLLSQELE